ncbi:Ricin-type beta-trefoil lectin domain-like [bacterium A37T11]|nr:Ricin-type beta-trefoil lectin domain-like [bacterium A37T11]
MMFIISLFIQSCSQKDLISPVTPVTGNTQTFPFTKIYSKPGSPFHIRITVEDSSTNLAYKDSMVNLFFQVYPMLVNYINPEAKDTVTVYIQTYDGPPAYTSNGELHIRTDFFNEDLAHIDVITHEATHFVQNYKVSPMFLQEGLPDFVRHKLKIPSAEVGWELAGYKPSDKLSNYYAQASTFLVWLDNRVQQGAVMDADKACRAGTYTSKFWWDLIGISIEQLWDVYTNDPDTTGSMISIVPPTSNGNLPSGVYTLLNRNSGFSADVGLSSPDNLKPIIQWDANGKLNQQWQFVHVSDNWYRIFTGFSSKVIEVSLNGEAGVRQYEWVGTDNQLWKPVLNEDGSWSIVNKSSGLFLSVDGASTVRGANLIQESASTSLAQHWTLTKL